MLFYSPRVFKKCSRSYLKVFKSTFLELYAEPLPTFMIKSFATIAIVTKSSILEVGWGSEFGFPFYLNINSAITSLKALAELLGLSLFFV